MSAPDALAGLLRAVSLVLLLQAAGLAMFVGYFRALLDDNRVSVMRMARAFALSALLIATLQYLLEAARMTGEFRGALDASMQQLVWNSPLGRSFVVRVLALVLIMIGMGWRAEPRQHSTGLPLSVAMAGAILILASFPMMGHTAVSSHRVLAAVALGAHVFIIAFWFGALIPLWQASTRVAGALIVAFSRTALWLVPGIFFAGVALALLLIPDIEVLWQPYGVLLLAKAALYTLLLGLAALNRWRFGPGISAGSPAAARAFRRTVAVEFALICAVLTLTAVMTTFYSPELA